MRLRHLFSFFLSYIILSSLPLLGNENEEEEFYILPDFVVTDDDDKGYYSANTLAGTRTNELTKNIPMTISTVNAEMIEDFKMKTLEDLGNFVPSIEAEGNIYNNNEIRFRGLLTKNQLYEFMPRYSPLDWYNVGRSDIIRGANSLIYGQADPGGKVNVISKNAMLTKNKGSAVLEIGDKSWHKISYDWNEVLDDNSAVRIMLIDKHREFDANYKYQSFNGATLEYLRNLSPRTRLRLHLETGEAERSLIGGTFKVGNTPTGLPNGIVADPKLADLISDELLEEIASYSEVNTFSNDDYSSIYPDIKPPNGLWEPGEELTFDANSNGVWDEGDTFIDVSDGTRVYGFLSRDGTDMLSKNIDDINNNGSWDTLSKVVAYIESDNQEGLSYGGPDLFSTTLNGEYDSGIDVLTNDVNNNNAYDTGDEFTDRGSPWIPFGDLAVGHLELNNEGELVTRTDIIGLEGTDQSLWETLDYRINDEIQYFGDTNNDGIIGINPETLEEDTRKMWYTWEDKNQNGALDYEYNQVTGEFTISEKVAFIDNNNNGTFEVSDSTIHPESIGNNMVEFTESAVYLNPAVVNRETQFVLTDEGYTDFNNNEIYDDADLALGGTQVRANNPNIWGITPSGGILVPDFIDNREDIRNLFKGIDYSNTGTGFGPDSYSRKNFDYLLTDIEHSFSDDLSMKVSFAFEDLMDDQLSAGWSANQLNFSSGYGITVRYPTLRSINAYNSDPESNGIKSPFEAVLVDLTNANYAHELLDTMSADDFDAQDLKDDLLVAFNEWYNLFDSNPLNNLAPHNGDDGQPVFIDQDNNGLNDDMIDYFVDEFLDLSDAGTTLEKYYELAKFSGRVMDFLNRSHGNYGESYSYRWGNSAPNNGRSLKDHLFDVLRGEEGVGGPQNQASKQIFDLDRYIDVPTYRSQLNNFSNSSELNADTTDYHEIGTPGTFTNVRLGQLSNPLAANNPYLADYLIDAADFSLETDGEKLIYDSIANWLIEGYGGTDRVMIALPGVEIWNPSDPDSIDGFVNVDDPDEVDLQKRAIAKKVYEILVENVDDPTSDKEFWDATKEVYDFFKYELHPSNDYGWIWEGNIQPSLLQKLDAILEDTDYLEDNSQFVDLDGDGVRDVAPSLLRSNVEVLQPFIKRQWKRSSNKDLNRSVRVTFNYDEQSDLIPGKQQMLMGIDLDNRNASRFEEQQVSLNARTWGDPILLYLRNEILSDYALLNEVTSLSENGYENFDMSISGHQYDGAPNWIANNRIPLNEDNLTTWGKVYSAESKVDTNGIWLAASGSYLNGKLRTLIGLRRDHIETKSKYTRFTISNAKLGDDGEVENIDLKDQVYEEIIYSPSIGGLYWFNNKIAIFGNYSESVLSPNGFQFDVFGDITPPETGKGKEIGFKLSTPDNVFNGQLTVFSIDKKNEQRQNISWPMLSAIYPSNNPDGSVKETPYANGHMPEEIWDYYPYLTREGEPMRDPATGRALVRADFSPKGYRVADESVRSEGLELDLYYNPTKNVSLFLGYAYLETVVLESALDILEGLPTAGTSDHNLNLTAKYSFKSGKLKGLQLGINQKYRSAALLSHYFADLDGDGQADYIPREVEDPRSGEIQTLQPSYNTLWLEDQHSTDIFVKWAGKPRKNFPFTVLQMNINNVFDNKDLISTGLNNARYTEGRNIVLSAGLYF